MTHSLHRQGTPGDLKGDFIVVSMVAKHLNSPGSADKLRRLFEILCQQHPVNFGDMVTGNAFNVGKDRLANSIRDTSIIHAVYTDPDDVTQVLASLRRADLGPSVVISGIVEVVDRLCRTAGLQAHSVEVSGGIWGRRDLLPSREILEITTMCGHGMVPQSLVRHMLTLLDQGDITPMQAAQKLARPCQCGILNPQRAQFLLQQLSS